MKVVFWLSLLSTAYCDIGGLRTIETSEKANVLQISNIHGSEVLLEAERFTESSGIHERHMVDTHDTIGVTDIDSGDWIMFEDVDFGDGKQKFEARVSARLGGWIQVRLDDLKDGPVVGKCLIVPTHYDEFDTQMASLYEKVTGIHTVYFEFVSDLPDSTKSMFELNWIKFSKEEMLTTGNPFIHQLRIADPSAHVWPNDPDTLWLYASHDPSDATGGYATMDGYHVFSTKDLKDWTDHGEVLHSRDVKWGVDSGYMWAPDACYKNGKYYFYFPHNTDPDGFRMKTGVAVSDKPEGPFEPLDTYIDGTMGGDPACFMDDDGQAYLYTGQRGVARLADNMVELVEEDRDRIVELDYEGIMEGAWVHKRNGIYYYSFTQLYQDDDTYSSLYATGPTPYGPFTNTKPLNRKPPQSQDHHSIIEFKGQWYYFYHTGGAGKIPGARRMVCVDKLEYNEDGSIEPIEMTRSGVPILDLN